MASKPSYAERTSVSPGRTIEQIERELEKHGCDGFGQYKDHRTGRIGIEFDMQNRRCRFIAKLPQRGEFARTDTGKPRSQQAVNTAWEQAVRSRWRALSAIIKAKLLAVSEDVTTFEEEFALHFVMANGQTVYEQLAPRLNEICDASTLPALMPGQRA